MDEDGPETNCLESCNRASATDAPNSWLRALQESSFLNAVGIHSSQQYSTVRLAIS